MTTRRIASKPVDTPKPSNPVGRTHKPIVASILHGAYGDLYEQAICLKHYAEVHPQVELRLFASTATRYEAFRALDLSFASSFQLWREIEHQPEVGSFFQFQAMDGELRSDIFSKLPAAVLSKIDQKTNHLPWRYMRDNGLLPPPAELQLGLSNHGQAELSHIEAKSRIAPEIWKRPTVSFLWRYRHSGSNQAIRSIGQKSQEQLVRKYSKIFGNLLQQVDGHLLVFGMNLMPNGADKVRTDNKYASFGLDVPADRVTYMRGLSWTLELEVAARTTVCCGNASGFTEALWLKHRNVLLMDAPPHYLAKIARHRMSLFGLRKPDRLAGAFLSRSARTAETRLLAEIRSAWSR